MSGDLKFGVWIELFVDSGGVVEIIRLEYTLVVVVAENVHHTTSVPVVRHTTAVVDVTRRVDQHLNNQIKSNQIYFQMQKQCTQQTCNAFRWYSKAYSTYSCPVLQFHL